MKQNSGLVEEQMQELQNILEDITWMAIRYAHGRHTTVPETVRLAVKKIREIYPDFNLGKDKTIKPPVEKDLEGAIYYRGDWLDDLYREDEN